MSPSQGGAGSQDSAGQEVALDMKREVENLDGNLAWGRGSGA